MLRRWPSLDPRNFSELKPNDPSSPSRMPPPTYCPTHDRTLPPPDQAVGCFSNSVVVEHIDQHAEEKVSMKRASCDDDPAPPERAPKMPRADPPYHNA